VRSHHLPPILHPRLVPTAAVSRSVIVDVEFLHHALIELQDDPVRILEETG
jgi:hypothetical protein